MTNHPRAIDLTELPSGAGSKTARPLPKPAHASIDERRARNQVNLKLVEIGHIYHPAIPLSDICQSLEDHGFELDFSGFLCGAQGRIHEQVGPNTWLVLTWYKFETTGRYEIVAYVS
jgi:hypothetical protein